MKNSGHVVSITGNTMVFAPEDGSSNVTRSVHAKVSVTLNGTPAKLAELRIGDFVVCSGDPATSVSATRS